MVRIPDHPYQILINKLLNLINNEPDIYLCIYKLYIYAKDSNEGKHQLLTNKRESADLKYFNDSKAFTQYYRIWMIFNKILKNTIQTKNEKY